MKNITYRTIIQKDTSGYHGFVPALVGCHTYGKTVSEVRKNIKEAIIGWIEANKSLGWDIPQDHSMETLESVEVNLLGSASKFSYA